MTTSGSRVAPPDCRTGEIGPSVNPNDVRLYPPVEPVEDDAAAAPPGSASSPNHADPLWSPDIAPDAGGRR